MYFQCYMFLSVLVARFCNYFCYMGPMEPSVSVIMQDLVDSLKMFLYTPCSLNFQFPRRKIPIFKRLF